jgi:hypothetical protein
MHLLLTDTTSPCRWSIAQKRKLVQMAFILCHEAAHTGGSLASIDPNSLVQSPETAPKFVGWPGAGLFDYAGPAKYDKQGKARWTGERGHWVDTHLGGLLEMDPVSDVVSGRTLVEASSNLLSSCTCFTRLNRCTWSLKTKS